jgi:hypothetical protein
MAIRTILQNELGKFGIDETTGRLYFDGKEVVTRSELSLSRTQKIWGDIVVSAAGVTAAVSLVRLLAVDLKWLKLLVAG